jgi:hypothetical protein
MLENGMVWKTVDPSNRDNQFVESRQDQRDEITEAWAFPKSMLGASNDVNRAIAEANRATFAENLVVPRLDAWRDMLNTNFLPLFGPTADGIEFDYISPVPADKLLEAQVEQALALAVRNLVQAGYDGEAVAEWADLPEMEWERPTVATSTAGGNSDGGDAADPDDPTPEPDGTVPAAAFRKRLATNGHHVASWGAL